ncbi:MAG: ABC transporter substrate-binding protein [Candidatus Thorarchaeota archaeon]
MEQGVRNDSRVCRTPPGPMKSGYSHQRPWPAIMASGIIVILSVSTITPFLVWAPLPPPVQGTDTLVICEAADNLGYLGLDWGGTLDPAWTWGIFDVYVSNCYDTLVTYDRERVDRFRPLLVTEIPSLENGGISSDGLTYRFTIRSDSPLTPEDVEYSFERLMVCSGFWANPSWMLHEVLLGVRSIRDDNDTLLVSFEDLDNAVDVEGNDVVFHLARTCPQFMQILASSCSSILSKAWCVREGDWSGTEETWLDYIGGQERSPLAIETQGYGPFMLEGYSYGADVADHGYGGYEEVVLVRNVDYWRGPAPLERVEFRVYGYSLPFDHAENWKTRKQTFLDGDADICYVPKENYGELDDVEGIRVYTGLPTLEYLEMNFNFAIANNSPYIGSGELDGNGIPPDFFSDIDVRKAFAYSIDYDTIINEVYSGDALHPTSPVIDGLPFHNPDQEGYTFNLDRVRQHFQQAWGGEVWNSGFNLTLFFSGISLMAEIDPNPQMFMLAEILKNGIEAINTNFHVTLLPWEPAHDENATAYFGACPNRLPFFLTDPSNHELFSTTVSSYGNTAFDSLIEAGMNTVNSTEKQAIYYELQRIYHDDVLGIPLVQPLTLHYQRDSVWGWFHNPAAGMDFYEMVEGTYHNATTNIIMHIEDLVDGGVLEAEAGSSLNETLYCTLSLMDTRDLAEASQKLNDFIDQVNALDLPIGTREELIALAQEIIEVLISTLSSISMDQTLTLPELVLIFGMPTLALVTSALLLIWKKTYH